MKHYRWAAFVLAFLTALLAILAGCGSSHKPDCRTVYGPTVHARAIKAGLACPPKNARRLTRPFGSVATVEQFDSTELGTVPASAHYVAGYVDGSWQTYWGMRGRWPVVVSISVFRGDHADCIDLEPGNPGPDAARPFVLAEFAKGSPQPCVYSMLSWMGQIRANLSGIAQCSTATQTRCYRLWDANWTYSPHVDGGFNCTQWTDRSRGLNLDESTCLLSFYPQAGPPPDPYAIFPKSIPGVVPSEYWTVRNWDANRCQNPVRRHICVVSLKNLVFFRGRISYLAHHVWGTPARTNWSPNSGGTRWKAENLRVNATSPTNSTQI